MCMWCTHVSQLWSLMEVGAASTPGCAAKSENLPGLPCADEQGGSQRVRGEAISGSPWPSLELCELWNNDTDSHPLIKGEVSESPLK